MILGCGMIAFAFGLVVVVMLGCRKWEEAMKGGSNHPHGRRCEIGFCQNRDVMPLKYCKTGPEIIAYFGYDPDTEMCMDHLKLFVHLMERRQSVIKQYAADREADLRSG